MDTYTKTIFEIKKIIGIEEGAEVKNGYGQIVVYVDTPKFSTTEVALTGHKTYSTSVPLEIEGHRTRVVGIKNKESKKIMNSIVLTKIGLFIGKELDKTPNQIMVRYTPERDSYEMKCYSEDDLETPEQTIYLSFDDVRNLND